MSEIKNEQQSLNYGQIFHTATQMTLWLPGIINIGVLYLIGICCGQKFDFLDFAILTWLFDYVRNANKGKGMIVCHQFMSKIENAIVDFVWVNYAKLIEQLPMLNIMDKHTIRRRFNKYCEAKILEFHLEKNPSGTFTFYRINPNMREHLLSKNLYEMAYIPELYGKENLQKYFSALKLEVQRMNSNVQPSNFNAQREDADVQGEIAEVQPEYSTVNNSVVINSSVTTTVTNINIGESSSRIYSILKELFGIENASFSSDFVPNLISLFAEKKLEENQQEEYLRWTYHYAKQKSKKGNIKNYFYSVATQISLVEEFKKSKQKENVGTYVCPNCGTKNKTFMNCNSCGLDYNALKYKEILGSHQKYMCLPPEKREEYDERFVSIKNSESNFQERTRKVENLKLEFGLID